MKHLSEESANYFHALEQRARKNRAYRDYQLIGLEIAAILGDLKHKSLYIKLAKNRDQHQLLKLAKTVAANKHIKNRGAYFMRLITK